MSPGWLVAHAKDAVVAKDFLAGAVARNLVIPHTIHADRGGSMTSKPVSEMMIDLGILRSHSRPRTSNDNPFSEAQFKTLKYVPDFPERFGSLADARAFCHRFFPAYNHEHRHSGIGMHTPASVHFATATNIRARRQAPSTAPTHSTPNGSAAGPSPHACPSRLGSTNPPNQSQPSKIHRLIRLDSYRSVAGPGRRGSDGMVAVAIRQGSVSGIAPLPPLLSSPA